MIDYQGILADFHADVKRAEDLLALIDGYRKFASTKEPPVSGLDESWPEAAALLALAPQVRTDLPVLAGSLLLYVCGRFENFVRRVVGERATGLASRAAGYQELPDSLRAALFQQVIEVAKSPAKYGLAKDYGPTMIAQFGSYVANRDAAEGAAPGSDLDMTVVALTESNMNSRTFSEVLGRVCVSNVWQELGKQARLKAHLGVTEDGSCRDAATKGLDSLMGERNSLAHPSGEASFPGADKVGDACEFLKVLSSVLIDIVVMVDAADSPV